jgi:uncharacterized protein YuzE
MHVSYNRKEDILVLELSQGVVDHAEESGPLIAHFSAEGKLVLLEILEASEFLAQLSKTTMRAENETLVEV